MVGVSILTASGLLGDLRGVTLRLGSGMPSLLPLPAGGRGMFWPARAGADLEAPDHKSRYSAPGRIRCSPWMRGGTKVPLPAD